MKRISIITIMAVLLTSCGNKADNSASDDSKTGTATVEVDYDLDADMQRDIAIDFFNNTVLGENDPQAVESYCTADLCKKLKELNEYDDGSYAVWYLRTGEQDGDGASGVTEVSGVGTDSVMVRYSDMGHEASTLLIFTKEDDTWKIASAESPMGKL